MKKLLFTVLTILYLLPAEGQRIEIDLNGVWEFDQTENAFPPARYTRQIPVPGLIHLAQPRVEDYNKFFQRPQKVEFKEQHNLYNLNYVPKYSWYRKKLFIPKEYEGRSGMITIKKSQYVTAVYVNGIDAGSSMACYTPVEFDVSKILKYGSNNEILIRVGERVWLPSEAAGGTDKEKEHYLPGIWDDVQLSFTGKFRVNRMLLLPSVKEKKVTLKMQVRSFYPSQIFYGDPMSDSLYMNVFVIEKSTGKEIIRLNRSAICKRDDITTLEINIPFTDPVLWTPEKPFLYTAKVVIYDKKAKSDELSKAFGMRDFTRKGKFFYLNDKQYILRGTNVTLQRFFEDPDCADLVWNRKWVKKFLIDYPKQLNWNAMRICVGIVPDFWYDLADEYGLLFQNEWLYWQNHGWNEQIRKEYTDWVWTDGSHPSIAIWDAINENTDDYIGNKLIPELKLLDPTRIWDAGYMTSDKMNNDEMDEPHPYQGPDWTKLTDVSINPYPLGNLDYKPPLIKEIEKSKSCQLVNEYGWIWLWRNGQPSKLTANVYESYLGANSSVAQNRELQAYWLQLETEWLRSNTHIAGVLAFCYLTNNYGYTGDWFIDNIKDLKPGLTMQWFKHCFAPAALFINLTDERYTQINVSHAAGASLNFDIVGVNNKSSAVKGKMKVSFIDEKGNSFNEVNQNVLLEPLVRTNLSIASRLPSVAGGYLVKCEFEPEGAGETLISRRYIKVGNVGTYRFFELKPEPLK